MSPGEPLILAEPETPFWGFGEIMVALSVFVLALALIGNTALEVLGEKAKAGYWQVLEEFAAYVLLFAAIKVFCFVARKPMLKSLGFVPTVFSPASLAGIGLGLFALTFAIQLLIGTPDVETPFNKLLNGGWLSRIAIIGFGVTLGPVIEELLFRGFLQPALIQLAGVFPGILITSTLFGVVHLSQNANMWQSAVLITVAGFGFGVIRHMTGSTRASAVAHVAYNTLPFLSVLIQGFQTSSK